MVGFRLFATSLDHYAFQCIKLRWHAAKKCTRAGIAPFPHSISMWPFILTRSVTLQRKIQASKAEVLSIVQDPDEALRLSPLVFSVIRDDKDPAWYNHREAAYFGGILRVVDNVPVQVGESGGRGRCGGSRRGGYTPEERDAGTGL